MDVFSPNGPGFAPAVPSREPGLEAGGPDAGVEHLLRRGAALRADAVAQVQAAAAAALAARKAAMRPPSLLVLDQWDGLAPRLRDLCATATPDSDFVTGIETLARALMDLALRAPDTGLYRLVRQEQAARTGYSHAHAVHAALCGALVAWRQRWPQAEVSALVKAALTMNLSIQELQGRMASEAWPGRGRDDPRIHRHAHAAAKMLLDAGVRDRVWLEAVRDHHERQDGGGYPAGRQALGRAARLLRLVDVFTARLAPRASRPALTPRETWRLLRAESDDADTRALAEALQAEIGTYPPGELVCLRSGEIGVVVQRRQGTDGAPLVAAVTDARGAPVGRLVRRDTAEPRHAIVGPVQNAALLAALDAERIFG